MLETVRTAGSRRVGLKIVLNRREAVGELIQ